MAEPNQTSMASRMAMAKFFKLDPVATVRGYARMETMRGNAGCASPVIIASGPGRDAREIARPEMSDCPLAYA